MKATRILLAATIAAALILACSKASYSPLDGYSDIMDNAGAIASDNSQNPGEGDTFDKIVENDFINTANEPSSTFSIDADGAAYAYMRQSVKSGFLPNANSVRIEEYLNYFTFDYADPVGDEMVAINAEVGDCPWNPTHKLLRLGLKGEPIPDSDIPDANYILLVDVSGSMSGDNRIELLKKGLINMLDYMKPTDRVAIITYSGEVKKLLESTLVKDAQTIKKAIKARGKTDCIHSTQPDAVPHRLHRQERTGFNEQTTIQTDHGGSHVCCCDRIRCSQYAPGNDCIRRTRRDLRRIDL